MNRYSICALILVGALAGCAKEQTAEEAAQELNSREVQPRDAAIAVIYNRSCRNCHTIAATGAPLSGDAQGWSTRMDKGMPTLVSNVVNGFGAMPPLGMCMDCKNEDFEALIEFMAQASAQAPALDNEAH